MRADGGTVWSYLAYTRPLSIPFTFVLVLTGYVLAPANAGWPACIPDLVFLVLVYSVLGWGGTNAFNSAEDRDEGPVNLLPSPPPLPAHLGAFGIGWGLLAILVTLAWPGRVRVLPFVVLAALLSLAYSYRGGPFRRLKEIGIVDNVTNALGCGPIAIGIGWGVAGPFDRHVVPIAAGFFFSFFGGYAATQIFQLREDDTYATARNYTSLLGAPLALRLSALAFLAHLLVLLSIVRERALGSIACAAWVALVLVAALHAGVWARMPRDTPKRRMLFQLLLLMASQVCFLCV